MVDLVVPALGESVTEATVGQWFKQVGDAVQRDEALLELETDKVAIEVMAPANGILSEILVPEGTDVAIGSVLGRITEGAVAAVATPTETAPAETAPAAAPAPVAPAPAPAPAPVAPIATPAPAAVAAPAAPLAISPAVRRLVQEHNLDPAGISATGKGGRLTKDDVLQAVAAGAVPAPAPAPDLASAPAAPAPAATAVPSPVPAPTLAAPGPTPGAAPASVRPNAAREEMVRMTRLRKTIAKRLKDAQTNAAMLTTYNEVDMGAVMAARARYREVFEKKHGVRLGFMSFFVRACVQALAEVPAVNAEIDGDYLVYKNYYHIGVAVGTPKGLVVPVLRDADQMSFAEIESSISDFGRRARDGKLSIDEMQGGTFTISNGGVYGSLLSMPILNQPQAGILGMHKIQQRPMAVDGEIEIRPMMYLAMSYDHRIIDGREAVTFLVRVKECLEEPERILFEI